MLQQNTLTFLSNLKKNNHKDWFEKNRNHYEDAKNNFLAFVTEVIALVEKIDPSIVGLEAKKCVFRINRDVRFSKDKSPYKTNMGASISKGGKKIQCAGYYFHLEPNNTFIAGGLWMPPAEQLQKLRQEIDYNFDEFKKIITNKKFVATFKKLDESEKLSRPPKGYNDNNSAIEFLKLKSFIVSTPVSNEDILNKNFSKKLTTHFETIKPLINFINRAIEE